MSDYLPTELLIEILRKLPVKPLIRFTAVCKSWRSIITSAAFIDSHLSDSKTQILLHMCDYEHYSLRKLTYSLHKLNEDGSFGINFSSKLEFPFKLHFEHYRIVGSCDGLVCLWDDFCTLAFLPIIIWNPSVRYHLILPEPNIYTRERCNIVLGFGFASSHIYKVVRLVYCKRKTNFISRVPPLVEIFSLNTWSWRRLNEVDINMFAIKTMYCRAFLNGVVHWLAYEVIDENTSRSSILAFDIGNEVFSEVMLPNELASERVTKLSIFVIGESLGVVKYDKDTSCDVWLMKEYRVKESWTKLYTIDLLVGIEEVVGFWTSGGEALVVLHRLDSVTYDHYLVAYDPNTRRTKDLGIYGTTESFCVYNYVESLLLFRGLTHGGMKEELSGDAFEGLSLEMALG